MACQVAGGEGTVYLLILKDFRPSSFHCVGHGVSLEFVQVPVYSACLFCIVLGEQWILDMTDIYQLYES